MPWVRIDDHFNEHPKLAAVGPVGWGIWLAGLAYCNRNLTDGFIPHSVAMGFGGDWRVLVPGEREGKPIYVEWDIARGTGMHGEDMETSWVIDRLVENGLWEPTGDGYLIHDYAEYQPTKEQVLAVRHQKQAAGQAGGRASAQARADTNGQAESKPVPKPVPNVPKPVPAAGEMMTGDQRRVAIEQNRRIFHDPTSPAGAKRAAEHSLSLMGAGLVEESAP